LRECLHHLFAKETLHARRVAPYCGELVGLRAERVEAPAPDRSLELRDLRLTAQHPGLVEQLGAPDAVATVNDGDEPFTGHVPAKHQRVGVIVPRGVQELAPAHLRAMHIRREEQTHAWMLAHCAARCQPCYDCAIEDQARSRSRSGATVWLGRVEGRVTRYARTINRPTL
jgi:hypothetical protein